MCLFVSCGHTFHCFRVSSICKSVHISLLCILDERSLGRRYASCLLMYAERGAKINLSTHLLLVWFSIFRSSSFKELLKYFSSTPYRCVATFSHFAGCQKLVQHFILYIIIIVFFFSGCQEKFGLIYRFTSFILSLRSIPGARVHAPSSPPSLKNR